MFNKLREIPFLNQFFCTPKVPLTFYYTGFVPVIIFVNFYLILSNFGEINLVFLLLFNIYFIIVNYCYAWFCDYMLYRYKNPLIQFIFMKSVVFNRAMKSGATSIYNSLPSELILEHDGRGRAYYRESRGTAFLQTAKIFLLILPGIKFLLTLLSIYIILMLPFVHIFLMKAYYKQVEKDANDDTNLVDQF